MVERVQELLGSLDEIADPIAQARVQELMGAILELYGTGMERILSLVQDAGQSAAPLRQALFDDGVVASLLLIHGLYPVSLEDRVLGALESCRPFMNDHGGDVELLSVADGVARLRLTGSCDGCPASALTLEHALKEAIELAAPDLLSLEVEGVVAPPKPKDGPVTPSAPTLSLPMVQVAADGSSQRNGGGYTECPSGIAS